MNITITSSRPNLAKVSSKKISINTSKLFFKVESGRKLKLLRSNQPVQVNKTINSVNLKTEQKVFKISKVGPMGPRGPVGPSAVWHRDSMVVPNDFDGIITLSEVPTENSEFLFIGGLLQENCYSVSTSQIILDPSLVSELIQGELITIKYTEGA